MHRFFLIMLMSCLFVNLQAQWEGGIRLGEPTGLTLKKYSGESALEFNFGRSEFWYDEDWYKNRGRGYYKDRNDDWRDFQYLNFNRGVPLSIQVHYLKHYPIKELPNLYWYWGLGGQLRFHSYEESYRYKLPGDDDWIYARNQSVIDLDIGVDGVLGLEYRFKEVPFSISADVILFLEIVDDFFLPWGQSAISLRYRF